MNLIVSFCILPYLIYQIKCSDYPLIQCSSTSSTVFNLCFEGPNGDEIRTTFGSNGYYVVLKFNSSEYKITSTSKTYNDIQFNTDLINVPNQGIGVWHTINNVGKTTKIVSFAVHSDAQILDNDAVPIIKLPNMGGLRLAYNGYNLNIRFPKIDGLPSVSSIWIGKYSLRQSNLWVNSSIDSYSSGDSGFAYSFQNMTINPNEQLQFGTATSPKEDIDETIILNSRPSLMFTPSNKFTPSNQFTQSDFFTTSFSFSESSKFSFSDDFSNSNFFSKSSIFSNSESFTQSSIFSCSDIFTKSDIFSDSFSFAPTPTESIYGEVLYYSMTLSNTYIKIKTVTFSAYKIQSEFMICNSNSECKTFYYSETHIPYIIISYKPTNTFMEIYLTLGKKKKTISSAQLIGIISGSTAIFFLVLGIIIIVKNKSNPFEGISDIDSSSEIENQNETTSAQVDVTVPIGKQEEIENIDMWI